MGFMRLRRTCIRIKSWFFIQTRIETNADPYNCYLAVEYDLNQTGLFFYNTGKSNPKWALE